MSDRYFTAAELEACIATPENLRATLESHGHIVFLLCKDENEERQRLRREGIDTNRIKFVSIPNANHCSVCGDLAHYAYFRRDGGTYSDEYDRRCHIHREDSCES